MDDIVIRYVVNCIKDRHSDCVRYFISEADFLIALDAALKPMQKEMYKLGTIIAIASALAGLLGPIIIMFIKGKLMGGAG